MTPHQPLPLLWLLSDARNDAVLERALRRLPPGSGFVFRHYHLEGEERLERYRALLSLARGLGHVVVAAGRQDLAGPAGGDGVYAAPEDLARDLSGDRLRLATAHGGDEILAAERAGADGVFLSPVYPTASHPDGRTLGPTGFSQLAQTTRLPVIALGGMTAARAEALGWPRWAAIDGLS